VKGIYSACKFEVAFTNPDLVECLDILCICLLIYQNNRHECVINLIMLLLYSTWSNAGITVNGTNDTYIQCVSSHLTSFAVLVASGEVHGIKGQVMLC